MNLCARLDRQLFKFCATRLEDLEFSVTRTYPMIQDPVDALLIAYISLHVAATRSMAMFVKALRVVQYLAVLTCCCALAQRHSLAVKNTASKESFDPPPSAFFSAKSSDKRCVIVGGGPVGLATAITLSRPPHSYDVIVLEKTEGNTSIAGYNPSRSYLFNVNPRGLVWFNEPENHEALEKLKERGYEPPNGISSFVVVPADPSVSIPPVRQVKISSSVELKASTNYWIPRHQMVGLLQECCAAAKAKVIMGKNVDSLSSLEDGGYRVHCSDGSCYEASLVVAADGIDSSVRSYLQSKDDSFRIKHYRSPSTGLKLKALQFPANFTLTNTDGSTVTTNSTTIYGIRGINKGSRTRLGFGLLPVKDPSKSNNVRPANTIAPHDHQLWQLKTGAECKQWFLRCFPRLPWDRLVDDSEWERYANAESTTFPFCQYSPGSAVTSSDGLKGIVMVGDACHAFPPDIGQGINAGLQDVVALDRAMRGKNIETGEDLAKKPEHLGEALNNYQRNRRPEHRALIRLARFGAPFQYRQPWIRHRIGNFLWTANVVMRTMLNKVSLGIVPPPCIKLMSEKLTFAQVMRRADTATLVFQLMAVIMLLRLFL